MKGLKDNRQDNKSYKKLIQKAVIWMPIRTREL